MMRNHEQVWKDAGKSLQGMLNADLFARWFAPIRPVEIKDDTLLLGVANEFSQIWLQDNFLSLVREAVNQTSKNPLHVKFVVDANAPRLEQSPAKPQKDASARPTLDIKLNPRYTFDTFVVGPNNSFAHAAALAVAQAPAKAYNPFFLYGVGVA